MAQKSEINNTDQAPISSSMNSSQPQSMQTMVSSMNGLSQSLQSMMSLFERASRDIQLDDADHTVMSKKFDPLMDKIDHMFDQNNKIAQGMVTIIEMLEEEKKLRDIQFRELNQKFEAISVKQKDVPKLAPNLSSPSSPVSKQTPDGRPQMSPNDFFTNKPPITPGTQASKEMNFPSFPPSHQGIRNDATPLHDMPPIDPFVNGQSPLKRTPLTQDFNQGNSGQQLQTPSVNSNGSLPFPPKQIGSTEKKPHKGILSNLFKK